MQMTDKPEPISDQTEGTREDMLLKLRAAARLKALGATWKEVARQMGYKSDRHAADNLRSRHRDEWYEIYLEELDRHLMEDLEPTAIQAQLSIIARHKDSEDPDFVRVAQQAAHSVLRHCQSLRQQRIKLTVEREGPHADDQLIADVRANILRLAVSNGDQPQLELPSGTAGSSSG